MGLVPVSEGDPPTAPLPLTPREDNVPEPGSGLSGPASGSAFVLAFRPLGA